MRGKRGPNLKNKCILMPSKKMRNEEMENVENHFILDM
jgi:hypothetical protein